MFNRRWTFAVSGVEPPSGTIVNAHCMRLVVCGVSCILRGVPAIEEAPELR
jgi:hypothetical protein